MNKQDLIAKVAKDLGGTKTAAALAIESVIDGITIGGPVRARASRACAFSSGIEMPAARPAATVSLNTAL